MSEARIARLVLPDVARAPVMQGVTWHSFDLRSGRRGAPVITHQLGTVSRLLSEATETTLEVLMEYEGEPVPDWQVSTDPARTMLVALDETEMPIWGGMVYRRQADAGAWASLALVTLEAYFDRRYIDADVTFSNADQVSQIARDVIASTLAEGIDFTIDAPYSNWRRDRTYGVDEDKTILSILSELADIEEGIEFTVDLGWRDAEHTILDRVVRVRNRLGTAYLGRTGADTDNPAAVFHLPGSITTFTYLEDYSTEFGANAVLATSSGEGEDRPESQEFIPEGMVAGWGGEWPMFEYRFTPSTSITETETLDAHAFRKLQEMWDGLLELQFEAQVDLAPALGVDWFLGDDIGVSLTCPRFPERESPDGERIPGYLATVRCTGWEVDLEARILKPRIVELNEVEVVTK